MDIGLRYENWDVDDGKDESEFARRRSHFITQDASGKLWYLTAGKSFAMPSLYQLYAKISLALIQIPICLPEKGCAYDFGIKDPVNKWNINLFYMEMDDKIKWETIDSKDFRGRYNNLAEFRSWGIEGQLEKPLTTNLSWINGMTWQKAEEKQTSGDPWRKGGTPQLGAL
ncbi:TonB-dependent receptor domain-containing protein [Acetomicrobium sp.]|uniref:TonB-dependent receptor domain-containing protein n=1 Tax=Acetomicrobium sp. TaxID=1872099 RepID=UPI003D953B1E